MAVSLTVFQIEFFSFHIPMRCQEPITKTMGVSHVAFAAPFLLVQLIKKTTTTEEKGQIGTHIFK